MVGAELTQVALIAGLAAVAVLCADVEETARVHARLFGREPEEIAEGVAWMLSDRSSYMMGSSMIIDGGVIARVPTGESFLKRFKRPYIVIHRVDLHSALLDACARLPNVETITNTTVTGYEDDGNRVSVQVRDGRIFEGAALIAADGIRSTIRQLMLGEGEPRTIGYIAHRTIVPMADVKFDVDRDNVLLWSGPGFHIVHYPLRNNTLFNIVTVFKTQNAQPTDKDAPHPDLAHHPHRGGHRGGGQ